MISIETINAYLVDHDKPANAGYRLKDLGQGAGNFIASWDVEGLDQPTTGVLTAYHNEMELEFAYQGALERLKNQRDKEIEGGVEVGGVKISSDPLTEQRAIAMSVKAERAIADGTTFTPVNFKSEDGWVVIDAATAVVLGDVFYDHVQNKFSIENTKTPEIEALYAAGDVDGLNNYDETQGW